VNSVLIRRRQSRQAQKAQQTLLDLLAAEPFDAYAAAVAKIATWQYATSPATGQRVSNGLTSGYEEVRMDVDGTLTVLDPAAGDAQPRPATLEEAAGMVVDINGDDPVNW
jgi:hypothetical protein